MLLGGWIVFLLVALFGLYLALGVAWNALFS